MGRPTINKKKMCVKMKALAFISATVSEHKQKWNVTNIKGFLVWNTDRRWTNDIYVAYVSKLHKCMTRNIIIVVPFLLSFLLLLNSCCRKTYKDRLMTSLTRQLRILRSFSLRTFPTSGHSESSTFSSMYRFGRFLVALRNINWKILRGGLGATKWQRSDGPR